MKRNVSIIIMMLLVTLTAKAITLKYSADGMICAWDNADKVGVFTATGSQMAYSASQIADDQHCGTFTSAGWSLKEDTNYYIYAPYNTLYTQRDSKASSLMIDLFVQKQTGNNNTDHLSASLFCQGSVCVSKTTPATVTLTPLTSVLRIAENLGRETSVTKVVLSLSQNLLPMYGNVNLLTGEYTPLGYARDITIDLADVRVGETDELVVYMTLPPCDLTGEEIKLTFTTDGGTKEERTFSGENIQAGKTYCIGKTTDTTTAKNYQPATNGTTDAPILVLTDMPIAGSMTTTEIAMPESQPTTTVAYDLTGKRIIGAKQGIRIENGRKKITL